ncbi:PEP/pyruvate-binding domain-containing protein [Aminirod propionatiphilus]|uniref:Pyruvate, phosphate dikinase n=1 Tax=Aminirod propionatiphilus TaxID=3415223 RepID=A0ACD1DSV5_9BACT|nr:pyruvate, phosphate dikinase [Synergistota bacterium]
MIDRGRTTESYFAWNPRDNPLLAPLIVGGGSIGGKGRSLLFALESLRRQGDPLFDEVRLPPALYVGAGAFEDFLSDLPHAESLLREEPEEIERSFLGNPLPPYVTAGLRRFLAGVDEPIVLRSSSLLEDSLQHSFAGKYRSTFLFNAGTLDERLSAAEDEVRRIYARIFFPAATSYRKKHGLGDDAMGLIAMRISGRWRGPFYYPTLGGVGFSRNFRRWTTRIRSEDGVLRLVFGLGTMSTKRGYARTYSLTNPSLRPEGLDPYKVMRHAQERFQVIDSRTRALEIYNIQDVWRDILPYHPCFGNFAQVYHQDCEDGYFSSVDRSFMPSREKKLSFTFDAFPKRHKIFFDRMKLLLKTLEDSMGVPADIEFAYEPCEDRLELLQSRPLWDGDDRQGQGIPEVGERRLLLKASKMVTNGSVEHVPWIVYVDHRIYSVSSDFHTIARAIGEMNGTMGESRYILIAPGRVGSSNPELGVPVHYNELTRCCCIVELGIPREGYMPELSYGTHFFSDLEVDNVLYMPVYEGESGDIFNRDFFENSPFEAGPHEAIRLIRGDFSVFMCGFKNKGIVVAEALPDERGRQIPSG